MVKRKPKKVILEMGDLDAEGRKIKAKAAEVKEKTIETKDKTEKYVKKNPWKSLGIAAGVGALIGAIFLGRKRK